MRHGPGAKALQQLYDLEPKTCCSWGPKDLSLVDGVVLSSFSIGVSSSFELGVFLNQIWRDGTVDKWTGDYHNPWIGNPHESVNNGRRRCFEQKKSQHFAFLRHETWRPEDWWTMIGWCLLNWDYDRIHQFTGFLEVKHGGTLNHQWLMGVTNIYIYIII